MMNPPSVQHQGARVPWRPIIKSEKARRRIEKFCGGLFLPTEIIKKENTVRSEGVFAKTSATNQTQAVRLRLCGKLFCFCGGYEVIFMDTRV